MRRELALVALLLSTACTSDKSVDASPSVTAASSSNTGPAPGSASAPSGDSTVSATPTAPVATELVNPPPVTPTGATPPTANISVTSSASAGSAGAASEVGGSGGATASGGSPTPPASGGAATGAAGEGGFGGSSEPIAGTGGDAGTLGTGGAADPPVDPTLPVTVWLAGDSTVANGNTPCPAGWGKRFAPFFDDLVTVVNSAVGGRSVRTWTYNVGTTMDDTDECVLERDENGAPTVQARWQEMLDDMSPGDTLLIQFGINDGSPTCDRHVGLEAFQETYGVLAQAAKDRGAQPVFITPVSSIACSGSTAVASRGAYVGATFDAGLAFDVPVIDLHQLSIDLYDELGFCPVAGGDVSASTDGPVGDFFCDDHTHFSDSGSVEIAELVARAGG